MKIYFVLYIAIGAAALCFHVQKSSNAKNPERTLSGKTIPVNWICFFFVAAILMFRAPTMGSDLNGDIGYLNYFDEACVTDLETLLINTDYLFRGYENGFRIYVKAIATIWGNRQFFLAVTAFLSLFPIAYLFSKKSCNPVLSWVIYLSLMPFLLLFSGLRQGLSIGLGAYLYILAEEKKPVPFLILCLLAASLHVSAVLLLLIYPLVNIEVNIPVRVAAAALLIPLFFLRSTIVGLILKIFPRYAYMFLEDGGGAYRYFVILMAIYFICMFFNDKSRKQNSYMNLFFAACAFQLLGFFSPNASRAGYYFVISLCILLPDVIEGMKNRKLAILLEAGSAVCFSLFGLYSIYITDWAMANPYIWFWQSS